MKKLLMLMSLVVVNTFAQNVDDIQVSLGIKGGICISTFPEEYSKLISGLTIGAYGDLYFFNDLGISLEIAYLQKGGILIEITPEPSSNNPHPNEYFKIDLYALNEYLEFPVSLKYKFILNEEFTFVPSVGISYAVPLPSQNQSNIKNQTQINHDDIQKFIGKYTEDRAEINSLLGMNTSIIVNYYNFLFEIRYYLAFDTIGGALNITSLDYKIDSFQFLIGFELF